MKFQIPFNSNLLSVAIFFILMNTSCKDNTVRPEPELREEYVEEAIEPEEETIQEILNGETELSHFTMLLGAYDLPEYAANDTFTVFVPGNDVFSPYDDAGDNPDDSSRNEELISHYIISDYLDRNELLEIAATDTSSYITSLSGEKIRVKLEGETIILEGNPGQEARITRSIDASNGIIHVVDKALWPNPTLNQ